MTREPRGASMSAMRIADVTSADGLRRVWGLGIGSVMTLAVIPYPVLGLFAAGELSHRTHNVVGAIQYLPLWALPVLAFTFGRDRATMWRLALGSAVVMAAVGVWSGDLVPSLSWMPLTTLLVLWPRDVSWRPRRPSNGFVVPAGALAAALTIVVAVGNAPDLVGFQRLGMTDSHSVRFHFSGMAAAYLSLAVAAVLLAMYPAGVMARSTVAASAMVAGLSGLVWRFDESAVGRVDAVLLLAAAALLAATTAGAVGDRRASAGSRSAAARHA